MRNQEYERELQRRLTVFQARYDAVLEPFGRRAPAPRMGQGANSYQREGLGYIQQFVHSDSPWKGVSLDGMKADALVVANEEILADAMVTASDPRLMATTPPARPDPMDPNIKAVKVVRGGKEFTEFYGEHFVRGMSQKGRRVVGWNTSSGPVHASGNTRWG